MPCPNSPSSPLTGLNDLARLNDLPALSPSAPLADKRARADGILDAILAATDGQSGGQMGAGAAVAFTGGKDSTITLALWRGTFARAFARATPQPTDSAAISPLAISPLAISVDTGLKFPQVTAFRDRLCADWNVRLIVARPDLDLTAYPVAQNKLVCCRDLKIRPLGRALRENDVGALLTGLRRDEAPSRAQRPYAEWREETADMPAHWQVNPILDWTEMDVWAHLTGEGLPYCELYLEGYRSLGCMPCTKPAGADESERAGRDQEKERQLDVLKGLGYF